MALHAGCILPLGVQMISAQKRPLKLPLMSAILLPIHNRNEAEEAEVSVGCASQCVSVLLDMFSMRSICHLVLRDPIYKFWREPF